MELQATLSSDDAVNVSVTSTNCSLPRGRRRIRRLISDEEDTADDLDGEDSGPMVSGRSLRNQGKELIMTEDDVMVKNEPKVSI